MLTKIKFSFILAALCTLAACDSHGYDWMSGSFGGTSKLSSKSDFYSSSSTAIETKTGSFSFDATGFFTLGDDTPLPGCHLQVSVTGYDDKFQLTDLNRAYKGSSQDMQGCLAQINGRSARVDINTGWITRDKNGDTILNLTFQKRDSPSEPILEYELRARKTSWFW